MMAFKRKLNDFILTLVVMSLPSIAATIDCNGKPFHCLNSTHFMICVDFGSGVSSTMDDFIIPCPPTTVCQPNNRFECEFVVTTTTMAPIITEIPTIASNNLDTATEINDVTIPFEEYYNTISTTTLSVDSIPTEAVPTDFLQGVTDFNSVFVKEGNVEIGSSQNNNTVETTTEDVVIIENITDIQVENTLKENSKQDLDPGSSTSFQNITHINPQSSTPNNFNVSTLDNTSSTNNSDSPQNETMVLGKIDTLVTIPSLFETTQNKQDNSTTTEASIDKKSDHSVLETITESLLTETMDNKITLSNGLLQNDSAIFDGKNTSALPSEVNVVIDFVLNNLDSSISSSPGYEVKEEPKLIFQNDSSIVFHDAKGANSSTEVNSMINSATTDSYTTQDFTVNEIDNDFTESTNPIFVESTTLENPKLSVSNNDSLKFNDSTTEVELLNANTSKYKEHTNNFTVEKFFLSNISNGVTESSLDDNVTDKYLTTVVDNLKEFIPPTIGSSSYPVVNVETSETTSVTIIEEDPTPISYSRTSALLPLDSISLNSTLKAYPKNIVENDNAELNVTRISNSSSDYSDDFNDNIYLQNATSDATTRLPYNSNNVSNIITETIKSEIKATSIGVNPTFNTTAYGNTLSYDQITLLTTSTPTTEMSTEADISEGKHNLNIFSSSENLTIINNRTAVYQDSELSNDTRKETSSSVVPVEKVTETLINETETLNVSIEGKTTVEHYNTNNNLTHYTDDQFLLSLITSTPNIVNSTEIDETTHNTVRPVEKVTGTQINESEKNNITVKGDDAVIDYYNNYSSTAENVTKVNENYNLPNNTVDKFTLSTITSTPNSVISTEIDNTTHNTVGPVEIATGTLTEIRNLDDQLITIKRIPNMVMKTETDETTYANVVDYDEQTITVNEKTTIDSRNSDLQYTTLSELILLTTVNPVEKVTETILNKTENFNMILPKQTTFVNNINRNNSTAETLTISNDNDNSTPSTVFNTEIVQNAHNVSTINYNERTITENEKPTINFQSSELPYPTHTTVTPIEKFTSTIINESEYSFVFPHETISKIITDLNYHNSKNSSSEYLTDDDKNNNFTYYNDETQRKPSNIFSETANNSVPDVWLNTTQKTNTSHLNDFANKNETETLPLLNCTEVIASYTTKPVESYIPIGNEITATHDTKTEMVDIIQDAVVKTTVNLDSSYKNVDYQTNTEASSRNIPITSINIQENNKMMFTNAIATTLSMWQLTTETATEKYIEKTQILTDIDSDIKSTRNYVSEKTSTQLIKEISNSPVVGIFNENIVEPTSEITYKTEQSIRIMETEPWSQSSQAMRNIINTSTEPSKNEKVLSNTISFNDQTSHRQGLINTNNISILTTESGLVSINVKKIENGTTENKIQTIMHVLEKGDQNLGSNGNVSVNQNILKLSRNKSESIFSGPEDENASKPSILIESLKNNTNMKNNYAEATVTEEYQNTNIGNIEPIIEIVQSSYQKQSESALSSTTENSNDYANIPTIITARPNLLDSNAQSSFNMIKFERDQVSTASIYSDNANPPYTDTVLTNSPKTKVTSAPNRYILSGETNPVQNSNVNKVVEKQNLDDVKTVNKPFLVEEMNAEASIKSTMETENVLLNIKSISMERPNTKKETIDNNLRLSTLESYPENVEYMDVKSSGPVNSQTEIYDNTKATADKVTKTRESVTDEKPEEPEEEEGRENPEGGGRREEPEGLENNENMDKIRSQIYVKVTTQMAKNIPNLNIEVSTVKHSSQNLKINFRNDTSIAGTQDENSKQPNKTQSETHFANAHNSSLLSLNLSNNNFVCKSNDRGRHSDNTNCKKFYVCIGNLEPITGFCPNNTVFSELRKQCTKNLSHCVRNNQFHCISEGRFSDYLNDITYYICVKSKVSTFIRFKLQCQSGYHLNKTSVRCVLNSQSNSASRQSGSDISSSNQSVSSAKSEKLVKENMSSKKFECKKEGKFPALNDCRRYYVCTKTGKSEYKQKNKRCRRDDVFNKEKKKCVDADSYECK